MPNRKYLTPPQLAQRYGGAITERTLANWRSQGNNGPKFTRLGGKILYNLDEVIAWEEKNTTRSTSEYRP